MKKTAAGILVLLLFLFCNFAYSEIDSNYSMEQMCIEINGHELSFWLYTPSDIGSNTALIVYLHGGTSRGDDLSLLVAHEGLPQYLLDGKLSPSALIAMPQAPENVRSWEEMDEDILGLISFLTDHYPIDSAKISLTGHSMGGIGTWLIGYEHQDIFFRIAPLSGAISRKVQSHLRSFMLPVWSFVGTDESDQNAYNSNTSAFPEFEQYNTNTRLTIMEGFKHREVVKAYLLYDIIGWLISAD